MLAGLACDLVLGEVRMLLAVARELIRARVGVVVSL